MFKKKSANPVAKQAQPVVARKGDVVLINGWAYRIDENALVHLPVTALPKQEGAK